MLRSLYRCVLHLHPPGFRKRFAAELLSIFDHTAEKSAAVWLLADGLVSLVRQWILRPEFWHDLSLAQQPAPDGIPSFHTLDPFRPRVAAVIHGVVLSTALFYITCIAIKYSWIHVLHLHIPEGQFDSPLPIRQNAGATASTGLERPTVRPRPQAEAAIASSTVPSSSVPARSRPTPDPAEIQNHASQSSAATGARPHAAALGSKSQKKSVRSLEVLPTTPVPQSPVQPDVGTVAEPPQALQLMPQSAAAVTIGADAGDLKLDAAERHRVISGAVANLTRYYVDLDVARKMADALLAHEKTGDDDAALDGTALAKLLTTQMRDTSHDKYVMMVYSTVTTPANSAAPTPEDVARYRNEMKENNCSIEKVTILPHNIGYLKLNEFPDASICGTTVAAAMASLNHADTIIFDLRDNPGGYANMVALIATYLFDRPTHLNDFYDRGENSTEQSWTLPPVSGNRLADKPAFVLTSHSTFSAAEGFSYDLKMLNRASLVGETTSGRGHMGMGHRIDDHFTIHVPGIRVINPISKTNWEGTGVEPDVKVRAADALKTAEKLAERALQKK
jgi:Peptidase family S41